MSQFLLKVLLLVFVCVTCGPGANQKIAAQINGDTIRRRSEAVPKGANAASLSESVMDMQAVFLSDSNLHFMQRLAATVKIKFGENHRVFAISCTSLGVLYMYRGDYEKSLQLLQQAAAILRDTAHNPAAEYAFVLNNLAQLYERMGQYQRALSYCQQAVAIRCRVLKKQDPQYALLVPLTLDNLASIYMRLNGYKNALHFYEQALSIRGEILGKQHPYYALGLNNLASFYTRTGAYKKALQLMLKVLDVYLKKFGEDDIEYMIALDNLALLYKNMGSYAKALPLMQKVLAWREKTLGADHPYYANSLNNLALIYSAMGETKAAWPLFSKASLVTLGYLRRTYASLSEREKLNFLMQESAAYNYLPSLLMSHQQLPAEVPDRIYENELALKGMVLEEQQQVLRAIRESADSNALKLYNKWRDNKTLLGKQMLLPKLRRQSGLDSIEETTNQLEQQLSLRSSAFRNLQKIQTVSAKEIFQALNKREAAVEFLRFRLYSSTWTDRIIYAALIVLPADSAVRFIFLCEEKQLSRLLIPSKLSTAANVYRLYPPINLLTKKRTAADSLYRLIWKPLEKYLKGIETVFYAPAGLLHRLAFSALQVDSSHLLIDRYRLNRVLSTRSIIAAAKPTNPEATAQVWGDIDYTEKTERESVHNDKEAVTTSSFQIFTGDTRGRRGPSWKALPGTRKEVESLGSLLRQAGVFTTMQSGKAATEESFKALDGNSPKILHLATHGFLLPMTEANRESKYGLRSDNSIFSRQQNPMFRAGLVLAGANRTWKGEPVAAGEEDGILTAYEIAQMDLSNTDLVVLSACETALGDLQDYEGVIGLQRAFKMAAVKQMILSLWRVPDKETTILITLFYKNWLQGLSTRDALRAAQLKMRKTYSPYYWAGFVLVE